ncbi:MAG TPA: C39 family peptidase [Candidatus Paceibacterota bacterium]|jgi:tetratricopeptide (TPR) repeat protein|nr:C39 family peptidase [Candidatus Paceibacterota bacterium]HOY11335.1 C39 family peptidase [Candidatus Paceibacterota bacterium]
MSKFFKISIYLLLSIAGLAAIAAAIYFFLINRAEPTTYQKPADNLVPNKTNSQSQTGQKILSTDYHVYQTFNNCAPAALSMALSYFGVNASQEDLANDLRPNHNLTGQNDDKSTPPNELAAKAKDYGLVAYYRPAGDIEKLKALINLDLPIVVRTLLYPDQDYAHYRVIKGYDGTTNEIIQDDSLEGKNLRFTYQEFERLWQPFNNAYLVIARPEQQAAIEKILGEDLTENIAWQKAVTLAQNQLNQDPTDINTNLNLAVANYYLGDFTGSVSAFEKVAANLPKHFLWYQNEPIKAYLALRQYDKVFALTDKIFADNNKADSELYLLRGQSYLAQDQKDEARAEFEKAVFYNKNYLPAQEALSSLDDD